MTERGDGAPMSLGATLASPAAWAMAAAAMGLLALAWIYAAAAYAGQVFEHLMQTRES